MKRLFTFFTLLFISFNLNAQSCNHSSINSLELLPLKIVEEFLLIEKNSNPSSNHVTLRTPFQLDSAYFYPLPEDVLDQKRYYSYNSLGDILGYHTLRLNISTNTWENYQKVEYERDANNNIIVFAYFTVDPNTFEWISDKRIDHTFDTNNILTQSIQVEWNAATSNFENSFILNYNYDSNNILTSRSLKVWDESISDWSNSLLTSFIYNNNDNILEEVTQIWLLNVYNNFSKRVHLYDTDQNLIYLTHQDWDALYLEWNNNIRFEYINVNDLLVAVYTQSWMDPGTGFDWISDKLVQYSYDGNSNRTQDLFSEYNFNNEMWEENRRWVYFHSDFDTPTEMPENTSLTCSLQNPIRTGEIINCQDLDSSKKYNLTIFDISGKVLLEKNFQGDIEIELPFFLESGIYFMNVSEGEELVLNEKIVIVD